MTLFRVTSPSTVVSAATDSVVVSYGGANVDPFGRLRVSTPTTQLDLKQLYDALPLYYDQAETSGGGTSSTYNTNQSSTTLAVTASTAGARVMQSKFRGTYQPGKGLLVLVTGVFGNPAFGVTKRMGYFDDSNGLFFELLGTNLSVVRRTYTSGAAVDNKVLQANWNIDKLDGTGVSGVNLSVFKTNIFVIDFEWLGVGRVRMGVNVDGNTYYCHEFLNANNLSMVYMGNPNLPIRYEIINGGTGPAASLVAICASVVSEGGSDDIAKSTYISRSGAPITLANQDLYTPIISVRLKAGQLGTRIDLQEIDLLATTTTNYEWKLFLNPAIAGTDAVDWVDVTNSSLQFDVTRSNANLVTGGYVLAGGYSASTVQSRQGVASGVKSHLTLGSTIAGVSDQLVLAVANIDGNGGTMYGGMNVGEYA